MDCGEQLYGEGMQATCTQPWGTEHTHHDLTAEQAVEAGLAR
jgi:hypothetical protein